MERRCINGAQDPSTDRWTDGQAALPALHNITQALSLTICSTETSAPSRWAVKYQLGLNLICLIHQ